jgi:hypothetical protein
MPEEVATIDTPIESQNIDAAAPEAPAEPATPAFDEATWKARLRGKDQALTAAQQQRAAIEQERNDLAARLATIEDQGKSELQRALERVQALEAAASAAEARATAATLAAKYPRAAELLGADLPKFDATRVAEIDGRLAKEAAEASEPAEPRIDPNSPRRTSPARASGDPVKDAKDALVAAGNPFYSADDTWR